MFKDVLVVKIGVMSDPRRREFDDPLLAAILRADLTDVDVELTRNPSSVSHQVTRDIFIDAIPHWLYVGDTPLHLAAAGLHDGIVEALLRADANVAAVNRRGASALHYACDPRPHLGVWHPEKQRRVVRLLVAAGAAVNVPDAGGATALHRAVRARGAEAVRELLVCGANVDARLKNGGSTALHLAVGPSGASGTAGAAREQLEIIAALLEYGANPEAPDAKGRTARAVARNEQVRQVLQTRT